MKRIMILSVCIVLSSASVANAEMIVSHSRTVYDANLDKLDFHITGLTGAQAGRQINGFQGTWSTMETGATIYLSSSTSTVYYLRWQQQAQLGPSLTPPAAPLSFINLTSNVGDLVRTGSGNSYSSLYGSWYTTEPAVYLEPADPDLTDEIDQTLIATIYVTKGMNVQFVGLGSPTVGVAFNTSFSSVPEPSTLVLLGVGAIGLLAHAWRRRK